MISVKEVEYIAKLARLDLSEQEKEKFAKQMGDILDYFNQLKEVNTEDVEPMTQPVPSVNVFREDKVDLAVNNAEILENSPEEEDGYFKVPQIT